MEPNRLFDAVEEARKTANWRAAFGEPHVVGDKTIIPVAQITYGFGLGYGSGGGSPAVEQPSSADEVPSEEPPEGGGGGGGTQVRPLGTIVVAPDCVYVEEAMDSTKVSLAGIFMGVWIVYQVAKTIRAVWGRK
jgi:uncharacterized spore protein YtfJ